MSTYETNIPNPGLYAQADNVATTAYQNALAQIGQKRTGILSNYGYTANFDPSTGSMSNLAVDPNNPYGQLQQLFRTQAGEDQTTREGNAARGIHGGLANQGLADNAYNHGAQDQTMGQNFLTSIQGLAADQQTASQNKDSALYNAQLQQTQLAIQQQAYNPANYDGLIAALTKAMGGSGGSDSGSSGGTDTSAAAGYNQNPQAKVADQVVANYTPQQLAAAAKVGLTPTALKQMAQSTANKQLRY